MAESGIDTGTAPRHSGQVSKASLPPERPSTLWDRRWITFSFWMVIACLGLPHWIWTTSIHRSHLPLGTMHQWAEGKACQVVYPLNIHIETRRLTDDLGTDLAARVKTDLDSSPHLQLYRFHVTSSSNSSSKAEQSKDARPKPNLRVLLEPKVESDSEAVLRSFDPVLEVPYRPHQTKDVDNLAGMVSRSVERVFTDEARSIAHLLGDGPFATGRETALDPREKANLEARTTRAFKYASVYHLTFSLFTATSAPSAWDIEEALAEYINPLVSTLSAISNFTVETQVQLHASFSPSIAGPIFDADTRQWHLQRSALSGFVNAAEWPLSPSLGTGATVNFVLYIPSIAQSPLVIANTGGSSWLIPQWGGVKILNPSRTQSDKLTKEDLELVMLTFADQLTALIGMPEHPPSLAIRVSSLTRMRATSLIVSASSTLGALARLTLALTSIAIPDSVAKSVDETIHRLNQSCSDLNQGRFESALENARIAEAEAEQAFFEPSMVGQVYFPDEHKAVYVPLLGPMAVPLVMAGIKELRRLRAGKQKTS